MFFRIVKPMLCAAILMTCGCIEVIQVITVNPDGTAKVEYDLLTTPSAIQFAGGGPGFLDGRAPGVGNPNASLDDLKRHAVASLLTMNSDGKSGKTRGKVAAWKDVKAEWAPDGRLRIKGTAYYQRLEDLHDWGYGVAYSLERAEGNGPIKFTVSRKAEEMEFPGAPIDRKDAPDFNKMTDKEWSEFLLRSRVEYQNAKPFLNLMFTEMKAKTIVRLPGEVGEISNNGFKKEGDRVVSREVQGEAVIAAAKKLYTLDDAALKAKFKDAKQVDQLFLKEVWPDGSVTVPKPAGAQFDFMKELTEARAAFPKLAKEFNIDEKRLLPGEKGPDSGDKDPKK